MVMMGRKSAILSILSIGAFVFVVPNYLLAQAELVLGATSDAQGNAAPALVDAPGESSTADPVKDTSSITGTVTDVYGDIVPGATIVIDATNGLRKSQVANDSGYFAVGGLLPNVSYRVTVSAPGFDSWIAPRVTVGPAQYFEVTGIKLKLSGAVTSVTV